MILHKLEIRLIEYGENKGKHKGAATFSGETGTVILNLNQHHLEEMFKVCADSIIETSKAAARHMTMSVIEHKKLAALAEEAK